MTDDLSKYTFETVCYEIEKDITYFTGIHKKNILFIEKGNTRKSIFNISSTNFKFIDETNQVDIFYNSKFKEYFFDLNGCIKVNNNINVSFHGSIIESRNDYKKYCIQIYDENTLNKCIVEIDNLTNESYRMVKNDYKNRLNGFEPLYIEYYYIDKDGNSFNPDGLHFIGRLIRSDGKIISTSKTSYSYILNGKEDELSDDVLDWIENNNIQLDIAGNIINENDKSLFLMKFGNSRKI